MTKFKSAFLLSTICIAPCFDINANEFTTESNVTGVSQYVFRGIQASQDKPAVHADYSLEFKNGIWLSVWGSNYDFATDDGIEVDFIAGYKRSINQDSSFEFGLTRYAYSGDTDGSTEYFAALNYQNYKLGYYNDQDLNSQYLSLDAEFEIKQDLTVQLHAGNNDIEEGASYNDFSVGLSYAYTKKMSIFASILENNASLDEAGTNFVVGVNFAL